MPQRKLKDLLDGRDYSFVFLSINRYERKKNLPLAIKVSSLFCILKVTVPLADPSRTRLWGCSKQHLLPSLSCGKRSTWSWLVAMTHAWLKMSSTFKNSLRSLQHKAFRIK